LDRCPKFEVFLTELLAASSYVNERLLEARYFSVRFHAAIHPEFAKSILSCSCRSVPLSVLTVLDPIEL
jgi:hypothetical protein